MSKKQKGKGVALNSFQELSGVAANGELKLAEKPQHPTPLASKPAIPTLPPATSGSGKPATPAETKAGVKEYDAFFALYAQSLAGEVQFWPLGFIPGPAVVTCGEQVVTATPDVATGLGKLPVTVASLPERVRQTMTSWAEVCNALGYQPTPWNLGQAQWLLSGRLLGRYFAAGMTRFRYRPGDKEVPFGVVLLPAKNPEKPAEKGVMVSQMVNPRNIPDAPKVGDYFSLAMLKDGRGPVQKLLRTWALMEANYSSRYNRDGTPREREPNSAA